MRTFALLGAAMLAFSVSTATAVLAWSSDQPVPEGTDMTNLADPDEAFKALQDKVNGNTNNSNSGFFVSGSVNQPPENSFGMQTNPLAPPTPYSFPTPFRR
jgi:hypothetical protein